MIKHFIKYDCERVKIGFIVNFALCILIEKLRGPIQVLLLTEINQLFLR